jgi:hypothetical protein
MQLDERKDRWRAMMAVLRANTVHDWDSRFLETLTAKAKDEKPASRLDEITIAGAAGLDRRGPDSIAPWRQRSAGANIEVSSWCPPSAALPGAPAQRRAASRTLHSPSTAPRRLSPLGRNGSAVAAAAGPAPPLQDDPVPVD